MILSGLYYLYFTYVNANEFFIFDGFVYFVLILVFFIFFGFTLKNNLIRYHKDKSMKNFIPTFIGGFIIFGVLVVNFYLWYRDSSEVILQANYDRDINGYSFEFRKDGSYLFENGSVLGRSQFRGKYKIKDSLIFLDKNEIDNVVKTNQLAIRYISENINGKNKVIVQIDKKHNRIEDKYFDFVINIDKR